MFLEVATRGIFAVAAIVLRSRAAWHGTTHGREGPPGSVRYLSMSALPDPTSEFGRHVRQRLRNERIIWWTTVSKDGTPQPNPVWFVWEESGRGDEIVVFNTPSAHRLDHIVARPRVALNFNADPHGNDVVVFAGVAERVDEPAGPDVWQPYLDKYGAAMRDLSGSEDAFADAYGVPVRIRLTKTRGFA